MKQKLTRERVFAIWYVLTNLKVPETEKIDKRFDYAKNRTIDNITPEVAEIIKARKSGVPLFDEYEAKRNEILAENAGKDETGNPIISNNKYVIMDANKEDVNNQLQQLTETYKDALTERQKEIELYNELINEEIEVDIVQASFIALPNFVNEEFTTVIRPMIKETDEEIEALL